MGNWFLWVLLATTACAAPRSAPSAPPPSGAPPPVEPTSGRGAPTAAELTALWRARAPGTVARCLEGLHHPDPGVRATAASALVDFGEAAREAEGVIGRSLLRESDAAAGAMAWVLVELRSNHFAELVLRRISDGTLARARRLDGSPFDAARLRPFGLALRADTDLYKSYLTALRDGLGGAALLGELAELPPHPDRAFYLQKHVFDLIDQLNDPGAADALLAYLATKPEPYFETRAALALSAFGDLRAAPFLARRLLLDPRKTYDTERDWDMMLKRDDGERVVSARRLADLAVLHPEAHAELRKHAEAPLVHWLKERPSPHSNGMRALAAMGSTKDIAKLRAWSNPRQALPRRNAQPPMPEEWVISASALRYVGALRDEPSFQVLLAALERRPPDVNVSMEGLYKGTSAVLGMTLRSLGRGGADGLSEWRDVRAFGALLAHAENRLNNEGSRESACRALGWVGTDQDVRGLAVRLAQPKPSDAADPFLPSCLVEALRQRPVPGVARALLPLLSGATSPELRRSVARAIGRTALDPIVEAELFARTDPALRTEVTLSLMLGGSRRAAARALTSHDGPQQELETLWSTSFDFWSVEDVQNGTLFRLVENVDAVAEVAVGHRLQRWARHALASQLSALQFDNGPHSATRVVLDHQLMTLARGGDERLARLAIRALALFGDAGILLSLSREPGERAMLARAAHDELLRPPKAELAPPRP